MKAILIYFFTMILIIQTLKLTAQNINNSYSNNLKSLRENDPNTIENNKKNFFKTSVTSPISMSYTIEYERILNKKLSLAFIFNGMPENNLPFNEFLKKKFGEDEFDRNAIENFRLSSISFSPQLRFYLSKKGFGRGFYIAPFFNHSNFSIKKLPSIFTTTSNAVINIDNSGKFTSNTGGILFGAQWMLGKSLSLDWSIAGPHYGRGSGTLDGVAERDLKIEEQNELKDLWLNSSVSHLIKNVYVNEKGESLQLEGPWGGLKIGISIGFRF